LSDELTGLKKEAHAQLDKLTALRKRLPEVTGKIESIDSQLASLLNVEVAERLIGLVEKRNEVAKELKGIPWLISGVRSYFHLEPGVQEVDIPTLPDHLRELREALSK